MSFPYSYYCCSCSGEQKSGLNHAVQRLSLDSDNEIEDKDETFDPSDPRSNYSLYPLEHLMWCEDCHDIRCPRCTVEEIVCWYCPNCLFEVPSSTVRTEGNRCTRNCFNCPECTAALSTINVDPNGGVAGPYILHCAYCAWSSLDIGLQFDSPRYIYSQLQKPNNSSSGLNPAPLLPRKPSGFSRLETVSEPPHGTSGSTSRGESRDPSPKADGSARPPKTNASRFAALKTFYKTQMAAADPSGVTSAGLLSPGATGDYGSPASLARIMALYSSAAGTGNPLSQTKSGGKASLMREAVDASEGLMPFSAEADADAVKRLREQGWEGTVSAAQKREQVGVNDGGLGVRWREELRPIPTLLRTRRSARCRACRHILVKPEPKVGSLRYRIKLVAGAYVPAMGMKALAPGPRSGSGPKPIEDMELDLERLPQGTPQQFLLKLTNPMFDPIKVTLATPAETPGKGSRGGSKVTILCPQFDVGANSDMWDEALSSGIGLRGGRSKDGDSENRVAEAGKVWEKGRNWTTVVVEVVPRMLDKRREDLDEDEDVLEIPIFVRLEYEAEAGGDEGVAGTKERREKRDLSYWIVLGVGRIACQ